MTGCQVSRESVLLVVRAGRRVGFLGTGSWGLVGNLSGQSHLMLAVLDAGPESGTGWVLVPVLSLWLLSGLNRSSERTCM